MGQSEASGGGVDFTPLNSTFGDTQDLAEILLYAEAGLGARLEARDKSKAYKGLTSSGGRKPDLPGGMTDKQSHYAQELSRNDEFIEKLD